MPTGLLPDVTPDTDSPQAVVETFLARLAAGDVREAADALAEDVVYVNVGLPTIRGRRRAIRFLSPLSRGGRLRFEVYLHSVAANGPVVLTERTDVIVFGPLRLQFWVVGRFDVRDGQIRLWRDAFDFWDTNKALVRGVLGMLVPALKPRPPASLATAPGRH